MVVLHMTLRAGLEGLHFASATLGVQLAQHLPLLVIIDRPISSQFPGYVYRKTADEYS